MPRVAFVTNLIPPYHKPMMDRLSTRYPGFRVLLSKPMEDNRPWKLEWEGLDVVVQKSVTLKRWWRHPQGFRERLYVHLPLDTVSQLSKTKADIVISGEMGIRTLLASVYRFLNWRSRLIVWAEIAESTEQGRGGMRKLLRRFLQRRADAFLVTGESGKRYLRAIGVPEQKLFKIQYTTDIAQFLAVPLERSRAAERRLLYAGQLIGRKGLTAFLEVLSSWIDARPDRAAEVVFAGDGPLRTTLESFHSDKLRLKFLGNVDYAALPAIYAQAGVFALPTLADSWAVVVNEALAAGLPVLGSVYGQAVAELVNDGANGWTFRADQRDEMFRAIERCFSTSDEKLREMRVLARATAAGLTPDHLTENVEAAIQRCWRDARGKTLFPAK